MKVEYVRGLAGIGLLVIFGAAAGCGMVQVVQHLDNSVQGSGKKASEARKVAAFHAVEFAGSGKLTYRIGSPQSVIVETDANLLSHVETTVKDGKLWVGMKDSTSTRIGLNVTITAASCDGAVLSGSGEIQVSGVKEQKFQGEITGSGKVSASGTSNTAGAVVSGSGELDMSQLQSGDTTADVTGSGSVRVAPSGKLDARIAGSGEVRYAGSPKSVNKEITGSGAITKD